MQLRDAAKGQHHNSATPTQKRPTLNTDLTSKRRKLSISWNTELSTTRVLEGVRTPGVVRIAEDTHPLALNRLQPKHAPGLLDALTRR